MQEREEEFNVKSQGGQGFMAGLLENSLSNAPQEPDDKLPRYGMSFLLPIPLYNQKGANFFGDFNPKHISRNGETVPKGNAQNFNYYPAFELIAFYGGTTDIPFEKNPSFVNEIVKPEPFDFGGFQTNTQAGYDTLTRTAKECAAIAAMDFREIGFTPYPSLIGFHATDHDKGISAVYRLLNLILPLGDETIFSRRDEDARIKNGIRFDAPFLDQMERFVTHESMQRLQRTELIPATRRIAEAFYLEIRQGIKDSLKIANTILNETEAEIKNPQGVKKGYDEPNLSVDDAPVPTDLYCLAHTNRTETEDKPLQASANIGREIGSAVSDAFRVMGAANVPPSVPQQDVLTGEEVQLLLARQREEMEEMFKKQMMDFASSVREQIQQQQTPANDQTLQTDSLKDEQLKDEQPKEANPGAPGANATQKAGGKNANKNASDQK